MTDYCDTMCRTGWEQRVDLTEDEYRGFINSPMVCQAPAVWSGVGVSNFKAVIKENKEPAMDGRLMTLVHMMHECYFMHNKTRFVLLIILLSFCFIVSLIIMSLFLQPPLALFSTVLIIRKKP